MNTDPSNLPGQHWIAVNITPDSVEYFDPLADQPTKDTIRSIKNKLIDMKLPTLLKFKVNKIKQQHGLSHQCGVHCIRFLDDRFHDVPFPLTSRYTDSTGNIEENSKQGEGKIKSEFKLI
jgi:hypothetical protein